MLWTVCLVNDDSCCANLIEGWMNYEVALTCTVAEELLCLFELNILHVFTCAKKSKGGEVVSVIRNKRDLHCYLGCGDEVEVGYSGSDFLCLYIICTGVPW